MLFALVKAAHVRLSFDNVVLVSGDAMNQRKGHNYLTVFTDLTAGMVLFGKRAVNLSITHKFQPSKIQKILKN